MKYYDRYSNVIVENDAVVCKKSGVKCSVALANLYEDEGITPLSTSMDEFAYYYTDSMEEAEKLLVEICGTTSDAGHSYNAYYFITGELLTGAGTSAPTIYNLKWSQTGVVTTDWRFPIDVNVASGRRAAILFFRDYTATEITKMTAKLEQSNSGTVGALSDVPAYLPPLSSILTSETGTLQNLIYDFPVQTDDYATTTKGVLNISTDEFLALYYDNWVGTHRGGYTVTKRSLGKDQTNTYDMYEYTFSPKAYTYKILLTSGIHASELSSTFGLAWFMKRFMQVVDGEVSDLGFEYLMNHVCIKCIPIQNPWGFNQSPKTYYNVNAVNISRNFTFEWPGGIDAWTHKEEVHTEWEYKGKAPFSEREARNLKAWVDDNRDAIFWIDCHTDETDDDYDVYTLFRASKDAHNNDDEYTAGMRNAVQVVTQHITDDYGKANPAVHPNTLSPSAVGTVSDGYSALNYAQEVYGIWQNTIEQSPQRLTWGTAKMNEGADITEYAIQLYAYLFGILPYNIDAETWIRSLIN